MKVYILIGGWDYEGFAEPIGVYTTCALAHEAKIRFATARYDQVEVLEYDVDSAEDQS